MRNSRKNYKSWCNREQTKREKNTYYKWRQGKLIYDLKNNYVKIFMLTINKRMSLKRTNFH